MPLKNLPDPILIKKEKDLQRLARELSRQAIIAVDTESNSLYAYQERVCLIQFSTPKKDYLVDPLAIKDLSPLGPLFSDPKVEKVFHAAEYDLIVLQRDFGFSFSNLFDTMLAARILGWRAVGLSSILEQEFDVHVNKRYQRANWGRRPLPPEMLAYARLDTHYLIPLRHRLYKQLKAKGRWPMAVEDFQRACQVTKPARNNGLASCWRINGARDLTPQELAVLQELCRYRDEIAKSINRPLFKVLSNSALLSLAKVQPETKRELEEIHGVSRRQAHRHGKAILAAIQRGKQSKPTYPPPKPRPSEQYINRYEDLRRWRKNTARRLGVGSGVVLPRDLLEELAKHDPGTQAELEDILQSVPWRLDKFGEQILGVLKDS